MNHVDIIHMNGRIYDPTLGRFLQADPHIQAAKNSQSYNRYSYVLNNPMSYTDPSGFFFKKLCKFIKRYWKVAVAAVAAYYTFTWALKGLSSTISWTMPGLGGTSTTLTATYATTGAYIGAGAASGAVAGAITTGSLKGTLRGAFSGAVFGGIGGHYGNTWNWERVGANTLGGGITSKASGGNFADGAKLSFALSVTRLGWEYTKRRTNALKMRASSKTGAFKRKYNKWNELLTDGGRDTYHDTSKFGEKRGNWLTTGGMAEEGGKHLYDEDTLLGRFVNKVSKTHDWMNSDLSKSVGFYGYNNSGQWVSATLSYNSAFQIYSFAGMAPAGAFTGMAMLAPYPVAAFGDRE
jgi:RHS repeat-associated protein